MNIDGRIVTASHNVYPPLRPGHTYILFVSRIGQGAHLYRPATAPVTTLVNEKLVLQEKLFRGLGPQVEGQLKQGVELPDVRQVVATEKCKG